MTAINSLFLFPNSIILHSVTLNSLLSSYSALSTFYSALLNPLSTQHFLLST
uniref:Uncharacterized protein n=1 Tax=Desertifilum tharense IPPAS B-1220 TaxID=1781255 RepID=A0ACD5GXZ6_9CYAN